MRDDAKAGVDQVVIAIRPCGFSSSDASISSVSVNCSQRISTKRILRVRRKALTMSGSKVVSHAVEDDFASLLVTEGRLVDPLCRQGVVDVGQGDDSSAQGNLVSR